MSNIVLHSVGCKGRVYSCTAREKNEAVLIVVVHTEQK